MTAPQPSDAGGALHATAWELLRTLASRVESVSRGAPLELDLAGTILRVDVESGEFLERPALPSAVLQMLDLCLPLCLRTVARPFVYAHLGQSLDGQIATASGASRYVTSPENLLHMHRLRALADAVIVGAGTVERDDPQLTTRLVPGPNPVRVVIDPSLRLPPDRQVFSDGRARTIVVCHATSKPSWHVGAKTELLQLASTTSALVPQALIQALADLGLRRLFVEGGGVTVSRFLSLRALDRLHVAVCPLFIGRGRPGVVLPGVDRMEQTLRPAARRFLLGTDVLFDCAFSPQSMACGTGSS